MIQHSFHDFLLQFSDVKLVRTSYQEVLRHGYNEHRIELYILWELASAMQSQLDKENNEH